MTMKVAFFDTKSFERKAFAPLLKDQPLDINFLEMKLNDQTAQFAQGCQAVCAFVNDKLNAACLKELHRQGVRMVALRSAGFNHVDLKAAKELGIEVGRVPGYSPYAVAEYTLGMLLTLNRKIHKSYCRVREFNFSLDGLVGFDLHGKTVGVIGTGKIGSLFARSMQVLGCQVLAYDKFPDDELKKIGVRYTDLEEIYRTSDVISLHVPLMPETKHLINQAALAMMKDNVYLINTGRGGLIDTRALIQGLKAHKLGGVALDVYEEEEEFFFQDLSEQGLTDDVLARLLTFPNVLVSSHQAFLTHEALNNIAQTTIENLVEFSSSGRVTTNKVE
jgi:D-lactate dehydrogenase